MREILFRGKVLWNGQHYFSGDWVAGFYAYKSLEDKHVIMVERAETQRYASYFVEIEVDKNTVNQYTGLKDKNGTMIYEGDIVTDGLYDQIDNSAPVVWNDAEAQFIADYEEEPMNIWPECKVIGNIHDTPQGAK